MSKMGRPKIKIDFDLFKKLCSIQATLVEIAGIFECSVDTIENRVKEVYGMTFSEFYKIHSAEGKTSLRRAQFKSALSGNSALLIFLGKQYLGQKDKIEQEISGPEGKPVKVELTQAQIEEELKERGIPLPDIGGKDIEDI
jgi:hypothetical protein